MQVDTYDISQFFDLLKCKTLSHTMFILGFTIDSCVKGRNLNIAYISERPYVPASVKPSVCNSEHNKHGSCSYRDYFSQRHEIRKYKCVCH